MIIAGLHTQSAVRASSNAHRRRHTYSAWWLIALLLTACAEDEPGLVHSARIGKWLFMKESQGLASNQVNTTFEDSKGDFWIGTTRGLSLLRNNEFLNYTVFNGLLDNNIIAISEDREGNIWVGTRRGVNVLIEDRWLYFNYFYNAPITDLQSLQNGTGMLIATRGYGAFRYDYDTESITRFEYTNDCTPCNTINAVFQAKDESIWIASYAGARKVRGSFTTRFDASDGLSGNIAASIAEDAWGNIWIGTAEGKSISKITGNSVSQVNFNNGIMENPTFGIAEDNSGNLWVGTIGNGLYYYDGAIMKQVTDGPNGTITSMLKDSRGNLWMGTYEGLAVYITNPVP